jgi:TonB family protein
VLQADTRAMGQTNTMIDVWKQWVGQVADGRYPLRQFLGGSERGPVFLTESGGPERQKCAIKLYVADPQLADAQMARWEQAAKLAHPHLLRVFHTGRCELGGARLFYEVMECADEDLSHVIPVRSLTAAEAGEMLRPALEALAYLHGRGLVHGRVKPSNIMAVGEQLKISSDGICAARSPSVGRGKPTVYDAPEAGTRGGSAAGDVWSLGVTLVEVLTQKLPEWEFKGQEEPRLPVMPAPFGDIAKQCLRRDPQQRCSLGEIAARLDPDAAPLGKQQGAKVISPPAPVRAAEPPPLPSPKPTTKPAPRPATQVVTSAGKPAAAAAPRPSPRTEKPTWRFAWRAAAIVAVIVIGAFAVRKVSSRGSAVDVEPDAKVVAADAQPQPALARPESNPVTQHAAPTKSKSGEMGAVSASAPAETFAPRANPAPLPAPAPAPKAAINKVASVGLGGGVAHPVLPDVPGRASSTIHGTVRVSIRVQADATGHVVAADLESAGPSKYFAGLAVKAAREWKFVPPTADGQPTASDWIVRFEFQPDGTKANAAPADR